VRRLDGYVEDWLIFIVVWLVYLFWGFGFGDRLGCDIYFGFFLV
jgi:hypothetical protein